MASLIQSRRPDARSGVFETTLVFEDRPVELEPHLERLRRSVRSLYGQDPPPVRDQVLANCRGGWLRRLRLTVEPDRDGTLHSSIVVAPFDPDSVFPTGPFATMLRSVFVDRGYGEHKWADRELLAQAEADAAPATPLLVHENGEVLEASRANLFAVVDRVVLTPPLGGEILPGVARAGTLDVAAELGFELRERQLDLAELRKADEIFLTGSLRGIEPVRKLDGEEIPNEGPITRALASGLRQRWFASSP